MSAVGLSSAWEPMKHPLERPGGRSTEKRASVGGGGAAVEAGCCTVEEPARRQRERDSELESVMYNDNKKVVFNEYHGYKTLHHFTGNWQQHINEHHGHKIKHETRNNSG